MRVILFKVLMFSSFLVLSCKGGQGEDEDFDSSFFDLNGDGVPDISYESSNDGYYEFVDRNFDGRVDVSNFYNKDDKIVSSKLDDNFDRILETKTIYEHGNPSVTAVDKNCDGLIDVLFVYEYGVLKFSEEINYDNEGEGGVGSVERVAYKFGIPTERELEDESVESKSFHDRSMSYLAGHEYRGCQ